MQTRKRYRDVFSGAESTTVDQQYLLLSSSEA